MSWLAARKNNGKIVSWLYRYLDSYGIEHQRSTGEKDKKAALRIQKHRDAYLLLNGCRHTFATKLANSGIGLPKVQAALGHTNLATTQRYVKSNMLDKNDLDKISFG